MQYVLSMEKELINSQHESILILSSHLAVNDTCILATYSALVVLGTQKKEKHNNTL